MFNKVYESIKKYIKENYKFLIVLISIYLVLNFPVNYYIYNGGGTISVSDRIKVNSDDSKQNFYMCYVGQMKANLMTLGLSYIIPSIDREKIKDEDYNKKEDDIVNDLLLEEAKSNSIIAAFNKAGKEISVNDEKLYVTYIYDEADTDLEIGDQITLIDDSNVKTFEDFKSYISSLDYDQELTFEVINYNGKKKQRKAKVINIDDEKKVGVGITVNYKYKIKDDVNIKFKNNETGPSGGLMMSLAIYDKLTNSNLSENKKVCGTGTISSDGTVGEIGGVKYKIRGAYNDDCDVFLAPADDNYDEALKEKKKNNYDIDVVSVKTLDDAINYLKGIE